MNKIVEYIVASKIHSALLQAIIESKDDVDFISLYELSVAVTSDTIRFLEEEKLIQIPTKEQAT